jgi:hypothetical protein
MKTNYHLNENGLNVMLVMVMLVFSLTYNSYGLGFCAYLNDIKFSVGCGLNAFQSIVESNSEDGLKTSRSSYIDFSYYAMFNYGVRFGQIIISPEMKFSVLSDARIIALTPGINISYLF